MVYLWVLCNSSLLDLLLLKFFNPSYLFFLRGTLSNSIYNPTSLVFLLPFTFFQLGRFSVIPRKSLLLGVLPGGVSKGGPPSFRGFFTIRGCSCGPLQGFYWADNLGASGEARVNYRGISPWERDAPSVTGGVYCQGLR